VRLRRSSGHQSSERVSMKFPFERFKITREAYKAAVAGLA
jgi:hypothetical protein